MADTEHDRPSLSEQTPGPIATDADTADGHLGPCSLCRRGILRGHRYALLVQDRRPAHLPCIGRTVVGPVQ